MEVEMKNTMRIKCICQLSTSLLLVISLYMALFILLFKTNVYLVQRNIQMLPLTFR